MYTYIFEYMHMPIHIGRWVYSHKYVKSNKNIGILHTSSKDCYEESVKETVINNKH